ncbi:peptide MFS transporter [Thalassotalea euphylliae]|uniref:MFS transporter n=1 Tax=Thalassotalea euphylliae TaxID=1655234 RepID=A0A3E0U0R0_9GAMM|nr:peptide MFS transporter [Thalassotalea euphylliae]REL30177.1 MFS transporter [Thalassotalea euphylliae]
MNSPTPGTFFGHPKGLQTLFFTEMWERMSYYGMRALLVLFMTTSLQTGGLEYTVATATAIYGLYTASVYFMGLPGGWIADRLIGGQKAVWYGGIIIMCGHIVLAIPTTYSFFVGLILVVLGTGLLKPNITALVGQLYEDGDARRDAGFSLYYMGINIGSLIGYTVTGYLQVNQGWHWAFGAAAVGMAIGLIQYQKTIGNLNGVASEPIQPLEPKQKKLAWNIIGAFVIALAATTVMVMNGSLTINPVAVAEFTAYAIAILFLVYFGKVYFGGGLSGVEKKRMWALFLVCLASMCFWSGFEQAGSSLNLFGRDYTDRMLGSFEIPTTWFQNVNPFFIIVLSPFFAALWINLGKKMLTPSYTLKSAIGLVIMGLGFVVMFFAAQAAASGLKVAPYFLVATYFLHTVGELTFSPAALAAVSRLAPKRFAGQMMGVFVLTYSMGNIVAGLFAGNFDPNNVEEMPNLYLQISVFIVGAGVLFAVANKWAARWENSEEEMKPDENGKSADKVTA